MSDREYLDQAIDATECGKLFRAWPGSVSAHPRGPAVLPSPREPEAEGVDTWGGFELAR